MTIPSNINRQHILQTVEEIEKQGIPSRAQSATYDLVFNDMRFPPKLVISMANYYANGSVLDRSTFKVGNDTPCFQLLQKEGFVIAEKDFLFGPKNSP